MRKLLALTIVSLTLGGCTHREYIVTQHQNIPIVYYHEGYEPGEREFQVKSDGTVDYKVDHGIIGGAVAIFMAWFGV